MNALRSRTGHSTPVPFLDLRASNDPVREAVVSDIAALIRSGAFTNGPHVEAFEREFAALHQISHCVGVASGLDALRLTLLGAGVGPGDEVIVPAHTFIATFEAVSQVGAQPVPVDISNRDYALDVEAAAAAIRGRTRALLPVHLYGQMADARAIVALSERHDLVVVEDACQAHGAFRDGAVAGTIGLAGCFSFYPGKNLGAFGDAGAVVTGSAELAGKLRALREHGQSSKYRHELVGWTSRLDTIQALVLVHKLPLLEQMNAARREAAAYYTGVLEGIGDLVLPNVPAGSSPVWHLYVVRTKARDDLRAFLGERGIGTGLHYPEPPHLAAAYASLGYLRGAFPTAETLANECLSLPLFPGITEAQLDAVASAVDDFFRRG